jgi:gluconate 2-dehydrogenase gamma chain
LPWLTLDEGSAALLAAVVSRIFPATSTPGAREAGVVEYIDRQLADYMSRPSRAYPADQRPVISHGLEAAERLSLRVFDAPFVDLKGEDQDTLLAALEDETEDAVAAFDGESPGEFFQLLRLLTIQGLLSDPMYGGNKDMLGWKLLGYPGAQKAYTKEEMELTGERGPDKGFMTVADSGR